MHLIKQLIALAIAFHCLAPRGSAETITAHLVIPDGTLENRHSTTDAGEYSSEIIWYPKNGGSEQVHSISGKKLDDRAWTIEAAFASEEVLSLCRGSRSGALELWQFHKSGPVWRLVARASLGSGTDVYGVAMPDAQTVEFQRKDRTIDQLKITDRPLTGSPLYRVVLMNGKEYWPYGRAAGGPTATDEKPPKFANLQDNEPPLKSPPEIESAAPQKARTTVPSSSTPSEELTSSTPWSIIVLLIVVGSCLLWLLLKRRS